MRMQVASLRDPDDSVRFFDRIFVPARLTIAAMVAIVALEARAIVGLESSDGSGQGRPAISIAVEYPGASALDVERSVVRPIERRLAAIQGAVKTEASARDGGGRVIVIVGLPRDLASVFRRVQKSLDETRRELPVGARTSLITRVADVAERGVAVRGFRFTTPTLLILAFSALLLAGEAMVSSGSLVRQTVRSRRQSFGWSDRLEPWLDKVIDRHHDMASWSLDHRRVITVVAAGALIALPGLWHTVRTNSGGQSAEVGLQLFGPDAHTLLGVALRVADEVRLVPGVRDVRAPRAATAEGNLAVIDHLNGERVARVLATGVDRSKADVVKNIEARMRAVPLPPGYRAVLEGRINASAEATHKLLWQSGVAFALLFILLAIRFRSGLELLAILLAFPLALVGCGAALLVSGTAGWAMALAAAPLTTVLFVSHATRLLVLSTDRSAPRVSNRLSLIQASRLSLARTTEMTLAGLVLVLAFALTSASSSVARPLAIALMGGLAASWFVVLFVVPSLYLLLGEMRNVAAAWSMVRARSAGSFEPAD